MRLSGAELVVRALEDEGVRFTFGIPGTHNIELYDRLAESERVRTVLVTDEQSAAFLADGVWRASGELACANLVPGAGLTHGLSGVAEAWMDGMALLVLGCGIRRDSGRAFQLHDVDQLAIAEPVTKAAMRPASGAEIYATVRRACALARAGTPGPVMVEIPVDFYLFRHEVAALEAPAPIATPAPDPDALAEAARLLRDPAARPLIYVGWGAAAAGRDLVALAEALGAPVATTITGKGVFPETHPLFAWNGFGDAAPPFVRRVARDTNLTLAIGCRFSEVGTASYSCEPTGPLIHVDIEPGVFDRNYPARVKLAADAATAVRALLPLVRGAPAGARRAAVEGALAEGRARLRADREAAPAGDRVSPARLFAALQRTFGPEAIYATDSGNGTFLAMEHLVLDAPGRFLAPVDYSCMGYAVPAAIGASLARPGSPVVALPGDGAFLMTGLELLTAASQGAPIATFVLRDRELAQIAQFQRTALNREAASRLPDYDVASLAEAVGVEWLRLDRDAEVDRVVAFAAEVTRAGRPVVVDTAIDYGRPTFFTEGVVRTNLHRLPFRDRVRMIARAVARRLTG
jgi:acetolactate synthase I/II/III large subunit